MDDPVPCASENDNFAAVEIIPNSLRERYHDPMGAALQISPLDVRVPLIPSEEFYNEPLNETIGKRLDYLIIFITFIFKRWAWGGGLLCELVGFLDIEY